MKIQPKSIKAQKRFRYKNQHLNNKLNAAHDLEEKRRTFSAV
jgi:hypothetical protein